jgi:hypothetical protein
MQDIGRTFAGPCTAVRGDSVVDIEAIMVIIYWRYCINVT